MSNAKSEKIKQLEHAEKTAVLAMLYLGRQLEAPDKDRAAWVAEAIAAARGLIGRYRREGK